MNRQKSLFVTAIVSVLMAFIIAGSFMLQSPVFWVLVALFATYGFLCGFTSFSHWLERETPLLPVQTEKDQLWEPGDEFQATYDQIRREVQEGRL